jgi:adenylosuccinate synthase
VGTTKKGIGPCYSDKTARSGLRGSDLASPATLERKFRANCARANDILARLGAPAVDADAEWPAVQAAAARLAPMVTDTVLTINQAVRAGKKVILEGAQGVWLDIDYGTYPYVTSSNTGVGGAVTGAGIAPQLISTVIGVAKAYTTRVGAGAFPTELCCETGETIRRIGHEFGSTTGRPRRTGWFDAVATSYAVMLNGITELVVTKMDVLDSQPELKICTAYELDGRTIRHMPADIEELARVKPIYETLPGWMTPTGKARSWNELPAQAQAYLKRLAELCGAPVKTVSVGPDRAETFRV